MPARLAKFLNSSKIKGFMQLIEIDTKWVCR